MILFFFVNWKLKKLLLLLFIFIVFFAVDIYSKKYLYVFMYEYIFNIEIYDEASRHILYINIYIERECVFSFLIIKAICSMDKTPENSF